MSLEFKYMPLTEPDGVRLIELQPASEASAALHCNLIQMSLSLCDNRDIFGHYTALSYVWGCPDKTKTIWIDGKAMAITESLFSALLDLRDQTRGLLLWADGICIKQSDNEEKAMQIRLMGRIFAGAIHTVIYLGPSDIDGGERHCLSTLQESSLQVEGKVDILLDPILRKEWFTRVWVFQELVFSANPWIQCGRTRVKWDKFYDSLVRRLPKELSVERRRSSVSAMERRRSSASSMERRRSSVSAKPFTPEDRSESADNERYRIILEMHRAWKYHHGSNEENTTQIDSPRSDIGKGPPSNKMLDLLEARRGMGVSDPRDMIFAHVGFASDGQHDGLKINYSKTCAQIYGDFARYLAKIYGFTTTLRCACKDKSPTNVKDLPSWVPDWTSVVSLTRPSMPNYSVPFSNDTSIPPTPIWLQKKAIFIGILRSPDTVLSKSLELSVQKIPEDVRQTMSSRLIKANIVFVNGKVTVNEKNIDTLKDLWYEIYEIWRLVVQDDDILPQRPIKLNPSHRVGKNRLLNISVAVLLLLALLEDADFDTNYIEGMALARMVSGDLALVPTSTQKGDMIAHLYADGLRHLSQFLFRPLQLDEHTSVDNEILKLMDPLLQDLEKRNNDLPEDGRAGIKRLSIVHCELVGQCFLDLDWLSFGRSPANNRIIALH